MKKINLDAIRIDGGTQPRERINMEVVGDYAEAVKVGIEFPPIVVFHDGADHWLADGFHRWHAHKQAGKASIVADIRAGTLLDAKLYAVGANGDHGLRRTNEDKRRAVQMVLDEPAWADWTDRKIADACGVSHPFVAAIRRPAAATRQQENRKTSAGRKGSKVESDSTDAPGAQAPSVESDSTSQTSQTASLSLASVVTDSTRGASKVESDSTASPEKREFDPLEELERAQKEIEKLTGEIQAAEADDLKAEAIKWRRSCDHAQRQQAEAMSRAAESAKREKWTMTQLRRCGKAVGEDDPKKIAAAVEAFVREKVAA